MSTFAIQRGPAALCTWDIPSGGASFHARAIQQDGILVVEETDRLTLVLTAPTEGHEYRLFIGDVPLADMVPTPEDAGGVALGERIFWRELAYFESARGHTKILIEGQPQDAEVEAWVPVFSVSIYVLPSKLGEDRYQRMADDMQDLSRSLLVDLYGKSMQTYDLRVAKEGRAYRSPEQELESIASVLDRLGPLLTAIQQRPASRVITTRVKRDYWGAGRLTPTAVTWLSRRSTALSATERPLPVITAEKAESFDIPEHRVMQALLQLLIRRANYCRRLARDHVKAITSEQHLRHIRLGAGPTIYESVDLPRIRRLEAAIRKAEQSSALAAAMGSLGFLRGVKSQFVAVHEGAFQRSPEYQAVLHIIRRFLLAHAVWLEGEEMSAVTKLTSRLFEQWCYLRIVEAFRACGLELGEWSDALRQNLRARFILDFDRGLKFEGSLGSELRLRFRYEPWILSQASAAKASETLYRGLSSDIAWCPDIVIECLSRQDGQWRPVYGVVLDCKYTARVKAHHWTATTKYLEIRSSQTRRQVVKQLWLIAPAVQAGIRSEDPAVQFAESGPSCEPDEAVRFVLSVAPGEENPDPFQDFAAGTINYLRRHFGPGSAEKSAP